MRNVEQLAEQINLGECEHVLMCMRAKILVRTMLFAVIAEDILCVCVCV